MARIRQIDIKHFRGIQAFTWQPAPGLNCPAAADVMSW